jgi:hypothetical protein
MIKAFKGIAPDRFLSALFIMCSGATLLLITLEKMSFGYVTSYFNLNALFAFTILMGAFAGMVSNFMKEYPERIGLFLCRFTLALALGLAGYLYVEKAIRESLWSKNYVAAVCGILIAYIAIDPACDD